MKRTEAEIVREYGPIPGGDDGVRWVSFDGRRIWFGAGDRLNSPDPESGKLRGALEIASHARNGFRRTAPAPDRGHLDPKDRSRHRQSARHHPGGWQRRGLRARIRRRNTTLAPRHMSSPSRSWAAGTTNTSGWHKWQSWLVSRRAAVAGPRGSAGTTPVELGALDRPPATHYLTD
jgi:hypothetical protein